MVEHATPNLPSPGQVLVSRGYNDRLDAHEVLQIVVIERSHLSE